MGDINYYSDPDRPCYNCEEEYGSEACQECPEYDEEVANEKRRCPIDWVVVLYFGVGFFLIFLPIVLKLIGVI